MLEKTQPQKTRGNTSNQDFSSITSNRNLLKGQFSRLGSFDVEVKEETKATLLRTQTLANEEIPYKDPDIGDVSVLACVTMYNEPSNLFEQTLEGMVASISYLGTSPATPKPENIILVFVVDGASKLAPSTRSFMKERGLLPEDEEIYPDDGGMTLYESVISHKDTSKNIWVSVALKHSNGGKLDSHRWILRSLAPGFSPLCWVQVDVGCVPSHEALEEISEQFTQDPTIAAVIPRVEVEPVGSMLDPLYAYQHIYFLLSYMVRLPALDVMGSIDLVPGQMSAMRWELFNQHTEDGHTVADRYLEGLYATSPYDIIRFTAEDALIGFELLCAERSDLRLETTYSAMSQVEPCEDLMTLLKQRRRWINGGILSKFYQVSHLPRYWRASHAKLDRKLRVTLTTLWMTFTSVLGLVVGPALIAGLVSFDILTAESFPTAIADPILLAVGLAALLLALPAVAAATPYIKRLTPRQVRVLMSAATLGNFALIAFSAFKLGLYTMLLTTMPMVLIFVGIGLLLGKRTLFVVLRSVWSYLFVLLPFNIMLQVYSVFNLHDASWGTKGIDKLQAKKIKVHPSVVASRLKRFRNIMLLGYTLTTILFASLIVVAPHAVIPLLALAGVLQILSYLPAVTKAVKNSPTQKTERVVQPEVVVGEAAGEA
ncbi:glycosyltransferase family protein [Flexibacterium corallicola]|uniref:glycosyltransferase family 2 protein n=1 Tax=Flexibacterium corallicola TaxID=3037259 RepID=UPI00286F0E10|nr:glycosyltransferase family 2 protein [Pseudovibrio sp. M1P-2-3]